MNSRRRCRVIALQALYQCDALGDFSTNTLDAFFKHFQGVEQFEDSLPAEPGADLEFARRLTIGVIDRLSFIEKQIGFASTHWSIARMPRVDRNILRIATYEIAFCDDIPSKVSINEAIEMAKEFSSEESPLFINGVLNKICLSLAEHPLILQEEFAKGSQLRIAEG
jgi:N utilization substance protein B